MELETPSLPQKKPIPLGRMFITNEIIREMNGELEIVSEENKGTTR